MSGFDITPKNTKDAAGDLIKIWRECFPADNATADAERFAAHSGARTLFLRADESAVGMCSLVPLIAGRLRGIYLFAVGILPEYRCRGGLRLLCRAAHALAVREGGDFTALVPADEALAATYRRYGYCTEIRIPRYTVPDAAGLVPSDMPPPVRRGDAVMPSPGFISYIRASYRGFSLGNSFMLCGENENGTRRVYEYIPGNGCDSVLPAPPGAYGLAMPLGGRAAYLPQDMTFYCSMGED